ncbi:MULTISPECIES: hypothetical protein [unclassified Ruegeria]|uniref:hypothetical protein n=1 Tax=unclassified Ruegeria TaxID=2625375 RepID=UPI0014888AFF|nr:MULTISPECIES: hypothetical protein [unclassified Ruegeria]NOD76710.1 hypothetical protein [Ruegeria sp. HKCCD4332]NOD88181.1 hypothetical protein [Ruegeria sp. HKCCD4318]NOD95538.1 hypothetical protein [Ruegeria sp. HKCCD4884]NOE13090.1 hypothetical protein [Ruegeria sp. HKCCD4318-2]NOG11368.1 hypothetical protein [Ruegeria sp. HKCCD4315]
MSRLTNILMGIIGTGLMMIFVLGLAHSISTGFAGFWGGLPFLCIAVFVIALALYNLWEDAIKKD